MNRDLKAAVIQMNAGSDKVKNIEKAVEFVNKSIQRKAQFITLPEVFVFRGDLGLEENRKSVAETVNGPTVKIFQDIAKKSKVTILLGSILEKARRQNKIYNTSILINPRGENESIYRKRNLFKATIKNKKVDESKTFLAGTKNVVSSVGSFRVGLSICYDLRFPDLYQFYSRKGSDILCVPSAFTKETGLAHWEPLLRARAIENRCFVVAPNQVGKDQRGIMSYGHSMIINPWGDILAEASGSKEEVIFARIDKRSIQQVRKILPFN